MITGGILTMIKMVNNLDELRKCIFKDLLKMGCKYIARDKEGAIFAYSYKPIKKGWMWDFDIDTDGWKAENISRLSHIFADINWEDVEPFEITYTNFDNVPVDTKVIVTSLDGSEWKCHFYKKVSNNSILVFRDGKTSWTTDDVAEVDIDNVRLA